jgi:4-hydroxybenzoyl-CoA thioesterase
MLTNRRKVTIEWGDCDPAGIVFYPRYFAMFDTSTAALIQAATGRTKYQLLEDHDIVGWPMVDTRARFIIPSRFGDEITIETEATELRRSSFDIRHRVLKGEDEALAIEASETRVWVGKDPEKPGGIASRALPETLVRQLKGEA